MRELKILVVNNYGQFCHLIHRAVRDLDMDTKIISNITPVEDILAEKPDGLILSGGPDMERSGLCSDYIREIDIPILGICLGHQAIALAYGGHVHAGKKGGYAEVEIEVLEEDDILRGLGPKTTVWASHADEVAILPEGFIHLARSDVCEIEAMRHPTKPIYGVQWHPEVSHTAQGEKLLMNFFEVCDQY
ncbi:GMP synthase subunit A [Methanosarcina sp. DH2]|jgi:GMP synthase (glutamine-hydrolysing)|uniref:GMP synthase subunit A n=1 Tax=Methanosarcina sp. DH2 TaxID=2605639 RepID=UPI001E2C22E4|nr:GMP synthase subunit A [Methanosarcina sp. DH2]MCC4770537.1 GMP synthase subunit A [Methanosarcina sp. DH2]